MELKIIHTFEEIKNSIWETAQTQKKLFCSNRFGEAIKDFQIGGGLSKMSSGVERKLVIINISITCLRKRSRPWFTAVFSHHEYPSATPSWVKIAPESHISPFWNGSDGMEETLTKQWRNHYADKRHQSDGSILTNVSILTEAFWPT